MQAGSHNLKLKFDDSFNGHLFSTQGDTGREFVITIRDEYDSEVFIEGYRLEFFVGNEEEVTKVSGTIVDNKFIVKPVNQQFKHSGLNKAQFVLYNKEGLKVGSQIFDLNVEESIENGATVGRNVIVDFEEITKAKNLIEGYQKTFEELKVMDLSLKENIKTGTTLNNDLNTTIEKANIAKEEGNSLKAVLDNSIIEGKNVKSGLDDSISKGNQAKKELEKATDNANKVDSTLKTTTTEAVDTNKTLTNTTNIAKEEGASVDGIITKLNTAKSNVEQIIAKGNLEKYATKEDLKHLDNNLEDDLKKIKTGISEQIAKCVLKEDGKGLSTNDYDNAAKSKVDAIPDNPKYTDTTYDLSPYAKTTDLTAYAKTTDIKTKLSEMTGDSTHRTVSDSDIKTWNRLAENLTVISSNPDTDGLYKTVEYRTKAGSLVYKTELIGTGPKYPQMKLTEYEGNSIKVTQVWNLTYDENDFVYKKEMQ